MSVFDYLAFITFIFASIWMGIRSSRGVKEEGDYLGTGRKWGLFPMTATLVMAELNSSTLLAFSSAGYLIGYKAISLAIVFFFGLGFYALSVAKKWREQENVSLTQFFIKRYGKSFGRVASALLLVAVVGFSAIYAKSLTIIFQLIFPGTSPWLISGLLLTFIALFTLRGGLKSVIQSDIIGFCLLSLFFPLLWLITRSKAATIDPIDYPSEAVSFLTPEFLVAITVITMFTYILSPAYGVKVVNARSKAIAKKSVFMASILVPAFYGCAIWCTSYMRANGMSVESADHALPHLILSHMPNGLKGVGVAVLFSAAATTLSSAWSAIAAVVTQDFLGLKPKGTCIRSICLTAFAALASFILSNILVDQILQKFILANIPIFALSFALIGGFYWKKTSRVGAITSTLVGLIWGIFSYVTFGEQGCYQWYWAIYGLPLIFGSGMICSLLFPESTKPLPLYEQ